MRSGEREERVRRRSAVASSLEASQSKRAARAPRRSCHCHVDASNVALSLKRRLIEERELLIIKWLKSRRHNLVTGY